MASVRSDCVEQPSSFWRNGPRQILFWSYLVFWLWAAISPVYPEDWLIENLLVFATAIAIVATTDGSSSPISPTCC